MPFEAIAPKLAEHGILGLVVVALFGAVVALYRHLNRVQELRVAEAKATADALIKAAESMEHLSEIVKAALPSLKRTRS